MHFSYHIPSLHFHFLMLIRATAFSPQCGFTIIILQEKRTELWKLHSDDDIVQVSYRFNIQLLDIFLPLGHNWGLGLSRGDETLLSSSSPVRRSISESWTVLTVALRSSNNGLWGIDDRSDVRSVTKLISASRWFGTAVDFFFLRELSSWCFVNKPGTPPSTSRCCLTGSLSLACACA